MTARKIFKVVFKEPPMIDDDSTEFFFSSLSAIYETFTPEQIGCKVTRLWNLRVSRGYPYFGKRCEITLTTIMSKTQMSPRTGLKSQK